MVKNLKDCRRRLQPLAWLTLGGAYAVIAGLVFYRPTPADGLGRFETFTTWASLMATTFLPHLGFVLVVALIALVLLRWRRFAAAGAPLAAVCVGPWLWSFVPPSHASPGDQPTLLILSANLLRPTRSEERLLEQIRAHEPDVIMLQEVSARSLATLTDALGDAYRHTARPRDDAFGQAIFSRTPFSHESQTHSELPPLGLPQVRARIEFDGRQLCVWNIHLYPPVSGSAVRTQATAAWRMGPVIDGCDEPMIIAGDFNSPWRAQPLDAVRARGFVDAIAAEGRGPGPTWPRRGILRHAPGIRIDHVAVGPGLECVEAWVGFDTGSDHAPVFARVRWRGTGP